MEIRVNPAMNKAVIAVSIIFAVIVSAVGYFLTETFWALAVAVVALPVTYIVLRLTLLRYIAITLDEKNNTITLQHRDSSRNKTIPVADARMEFVIIISKDREREELHIFEGDKRAARILPGLSGFIPNDLKALEAKFDQVKKNQVN